MKSKRLISLFLCFVLIFSIMMPLTGCSFIEGLFYNPEKAITEYIEGISDKFFKNFDKNLSKNSKKKISIPDLTSEQRELAEYAFSNVSIELGDIEVSDDKESATVELVLKNVKQYDEDYGIIATMDEYQDIVDDIRAKKVTLELQVIKIDDDTWIFKDLKEMVDIFYAPFVDLCFLDDEGNAINITDAYIEYIAESYMDYYVDSYWYDPIMGNPLSNNSVTQTDVLQNVFYFNQPMQADFVAELRNGSTVVDSIEVHIDGSTVATCDFVSTSNFASGTYVVALTVSGVDIATSDNLTVR